MSDSAISDLMLRLRAQYIDNDSFDEVLEAIDTIENELKFLEKRLVLPDDFDPSPIEGLVLLVTGITGAGKNAAIKRALLERGLLRAGSTLSVTMPGTCSRAAIGTEVLKATGYPVKRGKSMDGDEAWELARFHLKATGARILWIDELDDVSRVANVIERKKIVNELRSLVQKLEHPFAMILSGLPNIETLFEEEDSKELSRRKIFVRFLPLKESEASDLVASIVPTYAEMAGLEPDFHNLDDLGLRLRHMCGGAFGDMVKVTVDAVINAKIKQSRQLRIEHFATIFRKRHGASDYDNIFLVMDWQTIDPKRLSDRLRPKFDDIPLKHSKGKKR